MMSQMPFIVMTDTHSDSKALGTRKERFLLGKYVAMLLFAKLQVKGDNVGRSSVFGRDLCWCRALFRGGVAYFGM